MRLWSATFDMSSIPDSALRSEWGRRNSAKRQNCRGPLKLRPCSKCGREFGARAMRKHVPKCGGKILIVAKKEL